MEQTRFLMWGNNKRKSDLMINPRVFAYGGDDSWEEQAFAEDAGGCTWPPRSYSCSFCRREFRSAQALGGHMNVHRRDRARLKQSLTIPQTDHHHVDHLLLPHHHHHDVDHHLQFFLCNPNHGFSDPRVSPPPPPPPQPRIKANGKIPRRVFDLYYEDGKSKTLELNTEDCVKSDLDIYNRNPANESSISDDEVVYAGCKRRKIDLTKSSNIERFHPRLEVVKACSSTIEELDLELRLGEAPKVK